MLLIFKLLLLNKTQYAFGHVLTSPLFKMNVSDIYYRPQTKFGAR